MPQSLYLHDTPLIIVVTCIMYSPAGLGWPVNYHFVFYVCVLVALLTAGLTFILPKSIEKKRDTIERVIGSSN